MHPHQDTYSETNGVYQYMATSKKKNHPESYNKKGEIESSMELIEILE